MPERFETFVILADMRTGSNALEEKINAYDGLTCYGEVFNPHFVGHSGQDTLFGIGLKERDGNPSAMIDALWSNTRGLPGFRLFSDHDRRAFAATMKAKSCAKILLKRNPLDSYVSLKIARKTGQWWLGDHRSAKSGKADFVAREFEDYLSARTEWHAAIRAGLQVTGQTAFELDYSDLGEDQVIEGLVMYLSGGQRRQRGAAKHGRVQNPVPLADKVSNFAEMRLALQSRDPFDLDHLPDHEPARGPNVPTFVAARTAPMLFMPIKGVAEARVRNWLAALDGAALDDLETGFNRKTLRHWKRRKGAHHSFTVVAHPLVRAHNAFCRHILPTDGEFFSSIRRVLVRSYGVPLPEEANSATYDQAAHRAAFLGFLRFLKPNLGGQTAVRVDASWASQEVSLRGLAAFGVPDAVLREHALERELRVLAERIGVDAPMVSKAEKVGPFALEDVYDATIEQAGRAAYQRDYMMFGFGAWGTVSRRALDAISAKSSGEPTRAR